MRAILAMLALVGTILLAPSAQAQDDRYAMTSRDVAESMRCAPPKICKRRELGHRASHIVGGRPASCPPRAWCGCWLAHHLGIANRALWAAVNWSRVGRPASGPRVGAVVVWRHHVGKVTAVAGNHIRVLSGNDGHAVRDRWRTTSGVIAYRFVS